MTDQTKTPGAMVRVEARQCDCCNHSGINDLALGVSACHDCEWQGIEPNEDECPGCGSINCMAAACPKCGGRYVLLAETELSRTLAEQPPTVGGEPEIFKWTTNGMVIDPEYAAYSKKAFVRLSVVAPLLTELEMLRKEVFKLRGER